MRGSRLFSNLVTYVDEKVVGGCKEAFITKAFIYWKNACVSFRKRETSKFHIEAVQAITKSQHNVDEMLSQVHSNQKKRNGRMLMTIMQIVWFLSRHGLALRGYDDNESSFTQLLKLRNIDQIDICDWLAKKGGDKYTTQKYKMKY